MDLHLHCVQISKNCLINIDYLCRVRMVCQESKDLQLSQGLR